MFSLLPLEACAGD